MTLKRILIIAGPNGAGKTTFAREFLPTDADCPTFINADLIAAGLAPFSPETVAVRAGRLMLEEIARHAHSNANFAFETTLAGRGYARSIRQWQQAGYRVKLIFLSLNHPDEAVARVAERVRQGGHHVPEETIRRRFKLGLANFHQLCSPLVNAWALYDNSGLEPVLLDWSENT
jgi:predicted ABC-type ATPase